MEVGEELAQWLSALVGPLHGRKVETEQSGALLVLLEPATEEGLGCRYHPRACTERVVRCLAEGVGRTVALRQVSV